MNVRVLIVEDEPRLRALLVRAVREMDMEAVESSSGEDAVRRFAAQPADIVVLDLNLPGMSGLDALEMIRNSGGRPGAKAGAVILTAYGDLDAARRAIHLDAVEFLTKPCPMGDFERALDKARRRATGAEPMSPVVLPDEDVPVEPTAKEDSRVEAAETPGDAEAARRLDDVERRAILAALERHAGNRTRAAAELGISVRTLYYRLADYQRR